MCFAVSAGFAVVAGVGVAGAAPVTAEGNVHDYKVVRTVSNGTPNEGETITVKSVLTRTGTLEYLQQVKDVHPDCLTYVTDSAKVDGSVIGPQ